MTRTARRDDGFTLVETLVSLGVIGTVLAAVTTFFVQSLISIELSGQRQAAVQVATDGMELVREVPGPSLSAWLTAHTAAETVTRNAVPFQRRYDRDTAYTARPDVLAVRVGVTWSSRGCPAAGCTYWATTLVSTAAADPVFRQVS